MKRVGVGAGNKVISLDMVICSPPEVLRSSSSLTDSAMVVTKTSGLVDPTLDLRETAALVVDSHGFSVFSGPGESGGPT